MKNKASINKLLLHSATDLTLSDRRLYNYLLHHALAKLPKQLDFTLSFNDLTGVYGVGLPPLDRLKESIQRLMRTLIEFELGQEWVITSLLERAIITKSDHTLSYSYPLQCRTLFTNPLLLEKCLIQAHFTQKYSSLLYEILSDCFYQKQSSYTIPIKDLRKYLMLTGDKLANFSDLDRFLLIPAIKEINAYASFAVKYDALRKGMKVTHLVFEMTSKRNIAASDDPKQVIPPKRPRLFIDNPDLERAYAYLLNAETKERRKYFELAIKQALKHQHKTDEEEFDRPDLWFKWIATVLLKKLK